MKVAMHRTSLVSASLAVFIAGCSNTPTERSVEKVLVLSAELREDKVVVEKRSLGDYGLSKVNASLELQASARHDVDLLGIDPSGGFLFVSAHAGFVQSFPENIGAVHTVWILRANPLELIREYALAEHTTEPYWVADRTLRFEGGDEKGNCIEYNVEGDGTIARTILAEVLPRPATGHEAEAAQVLNDHGFKWVAHPGSPQRFRSALFGGLRGNPVVSEDGALIAASVWVDSELKHSVVFLQKKNGKWEQKKAGVDGFPHFAVSGKWVAVASAVGPGFASEPEAPTGELVFNCRFYNPELELVKGDLAAHAIDIY